MKIDVTEDGVIRLKEVFNSIILETTEGNRFTICMRDNGLEIGLVDDSKKHSGPEVYLRWFAAKDGDIKELLPLSGAKKETGIDTISQRLGHDTLA